MKCLCTLPLLLISWWPVPTAEAQPQRLHIERLNVLDGLSQGSVYSMIQDRRGFLWIGTESGLNRYDGYTFKIYAPIPFDTTSLLPGGISDIEEARDGAIWIASTEYGVSRFEPSTEIATRYRHVPEDPHSLPEGPFNAVLETRDGAIWVGTRHGLSRMDPAAPGHFTHYVHDPADPSSLSDNLVRFLFEDASGMVWLSTPTALSRMDPAAPGRFTRYLEGPDGIRSLLRRVRRIYEDPRVPGVLWVGSRSGLVRLDTKTGEAKHYLPNPANAEGQRVADVTPDLTAPGVLWVTVPDFGIARFDMDTGAFTRYRHDPKDPHSLPDDKVCTILTDRAGAVWIGHADGGGVSRFDPMAIGFQVLRHDPNSLAGESVWSIHEDRAGGLWVGGFYRNTPYLQRIDRGTGKVVIRTTLIEGRRLLEASSPSGIVRAMTEDQEGTLWLGTPDGLYRYDPDTNRFTYALQDVPGTTTLSGNTIFDLLASRDGTLWVATSSGGGGVDRFDPATNTVTRFLNTGGRGVLSLFEDHAGMLWASIDDDGIVQFNPATGESIRYRHDPADTGTIAGGYVYSMIERDREPGVLWIASSSGGLCRLEVSSGAFTHYTTKDGLPDNNIFALLEDENGHLWMSSSRGLARFDPDTGEVRPFGLEDGLQGLEFHPWASAKGRNGELFFGGVNGLNAFYPSQITINQVPPQVALTDFRLFNLPVVRGPDARLKVALSQTEEIRLRHHQDHIDFNFVALHYKNPAQNRYAYRLEGFDRDWIDSGTDRKATYTNLPPGRYTFRVKASNSDGVWNEEGAAVRLTILPPWWSTSWAYLGYVLLFGGGVFAVHTVQRRRVQEVERRRAAFGEAQLRAELAETQAHYLESLDQAKSRFFASISHEFRTPLTLLLGPLRDRIDGHIDAEGLASHAPLMHRSGRRLLRLINQLLDLSRLEAGGMQLNARRRDLVPLLRRHVLTFASHAEREGVALVFTAEPEVIETAFDADKLEKVLSNLLSNAFKFTPSAGRIRVTVKKEDDQVVIAVRDTGKGMAAEELPLVFDRFYQADSSSTRRHEGSGIGLSLAKELVELHGGTIGVESERGFGSTFTVRLPLRRDDERGEEADDEPRASGEPTGEPHEEGQEEPAPVLTWQQQSEDPLQESAGTPADAPTILIVEDNADMRGYLRSHLAGTYRIIEAEDGAEGLRQARGHQPDLVISDVMMPEMDGFSLCEAIKAEEALSHIPVVLLTARADEESRIEGFQSGADDYLPKPFRLEELTTRVENLVEIRRRLRERFSESVRLGPSEILVNTADGAFVERMRDVVEAQMGDSQFGVIRLAEEMGMSERQLHRRVKETAGLTPAGYIRMMRLERASQLLEQQAGRVSEVAYAVGFSSARHFSRVYRQTFGRAPSEDVGADPGQAATG